MTTPRLVQGNTRTYKFNTLADMRALSGQWLSEGDVAIFTGTQSADGAERIYTWNTTSTATDNSDTRIKLTDTTTGRFVALRTPREAYVTDYDGVDTTGAADSRSGIQAALDAMTSGGDLVFPKGTYAIGRQTGTEQTGPASANDYVTERWGLKITNSNTRLIFEKGAKLKRFTAPSGSWSDPNGAADAASPSYAILHIGETESNDAGDQVTDIEIVGGHFEGNDIRHSTSTLAIVDHNTGIFIRNADRVTIDGTRFSKVDSSAIFSWLPGSLVNTTQVTNLAVINCDFDGVEHTTTERALMHCVWMGGVDYWSVINCKFKWVDNGVGVDGTYFNMSDTGNWTETTNSLGSVPRGGRGGQIIGNRFEECSEHGIYAETVDLIVNDNNFHNVSQYCTNDVKCRVRGLTASGNNFFNRKRAWSFTEASGDVNVSGGNVVLNHIDAIAVSLDNQDISTWIGNRYEWAPNAVQTDLGTHSGSSSATVFTNPRLDLTVNALVGATIENDTDGSSGTVTANTATTITVGSLTGGTDNDWDSGDQAKIKNISATAATRTIAGTDRFKGFAAGQTVLVSGFSETANNIEFEVESATDDQIVVLDPGGVMVDDAAGDDVSVIADNLPIMRGMTIDGVNMRNEITDYTGSSQGYCFNINSDQNPTSGYSRGWSVQGVNLTNNSIYGFRQGVHYNNDSVRNVTIDGNTFVGVGFIERDFDIDTSMESEAVIALHSNASSMMAETVFTNNSVYGFKNYLKQDGGTEVDSRTYGIPITKGNFFKYVQQLWGISTAANSGAGATGTHDGAGNAATLSDSGASFTVDAFVGRQVFNTTDGSSGRITANTATTVTATLAGGTDNDWDASDAYEIDGANIGTDGNAVTLTNGTDVVNWTDHGLGDDVRVRFKGTLPSELDTNMWYFVDVVDQNSFRVCLHETDVGVAYVTFTSDGSSVTVDTRYSSSFVAPDTSTFDAVFEGNKGAYVFDFDRELAIGNNITSNGTLAGCSSGNQARLGTFKYVSTTDIRLYLRADGTQVNLA